MSESPRPDRSACLIYNPVAGQGDPEADLELIRAFLEPEFDLDIRLTSEEIGADQLAQAALAEGAELIIASGGDGTLSAVATAMIGTGIPLGILSRGTANAFANALGIPVAIELACEVILDGVARTVDAARCNGLPMVLLAGIGLEAQMVAQADREAKNRLGALAYVFAGLQQLSALQPFEASIEAPGLQAAGTVSAITIANAAPPTSVLAQGSGGVIFDDGLLDVTIFSPTETAGVLAAAFALLQGALRSEATTHPDVSHLLTPWIRVSTDPPQPIAIDGEVIGETPIEVVCVPGGLRVLVPNAVEVLLVATEALEAI